MYLHPSIASSVSINFYFLRRATIAKTNTTMTIIATTAISTISQQASPVVDVVVGVVTAVVVGGVVTDVIVVGVVVVTPVITANAVKWFT